MSLFDRLFENDESRKAMERDSKAKLEPSNPKVLIDKLRKGEWRSRPEARQPLSKDIHPSQDGVGVWRRSNTRNKGIKLADSAKAETDPMKQEIKWNLADRANKRADELFSRKHAKNHDMQDRHDAAQMDRAETRKSLRTLQVGRKLGATTPEQAEKMIKQN